MVNWRISTGPSGTHIDPVCEMKVSEATAQHKTEHMGKTFYFCSPLCRKQFEEDPNKYMETKT
jgi:Cu+-exporting ATPase